VLEEDLKSRHKVQPISLQQDIRLVYTFSYPQGFLMLYRIGFFYLQVEKDN
jgi:mRNA-degrading endonuclease YafQ of YafQ-DinJ toxin-antitoxin module